MRDIYEQLLMLYETEENQSLKEDIDSNNNSRSVELDMSDIKPILNVIRQVNKKLDTDPKYLKNGKHRYFFHKNMPVDLQTEWIEELILKASNESSYGVDQVWAVFDMILGPTCNKEALDRARENILDAYW